MARKFPAEKLPQKHMRKPQKKPAKTSMTVAIQFNLECSKYFQNNIPTDRSGRLIVKFEDYGIILA